MNEEIILSMVNLYVKDGAITYVQFDKIFNVLSRKEQYGVVEVLHRNGINLIDEHVNEEDFVLDLNAEEPETDDFEILYDEDIFKDKGIVEDDYFFINKNVKQSNEILCSLIQEGNRQAVQDLCVKNKGLVDKYVAGYQKKYGNRLDFDDLEQVGFIGLIKAAKKFDIGQGTAFSTYAVFWIKQSITREIMDNGYVIRIPVHMMERINKVVALDNKFASQQLNIEERIMSISDELNLDESAVKECLIIKNHYLTYASLDSPVGEDEESVLGEFLPDERTPLVDEMVASLILKESLNNLLNTLTLREREILRLRFGLDDGRERTLEEIGKEFNVTRERIRQIEEKALRKLRHPSRSRKLRDYLE
ncbi:MAG: sigma-70 family RNA polymerase sigma factor [Clostridiales bacterium]|nr:sigma-70 family RNA polymerase sigma factor [Clostridiales bacterium]